MSKMSEGRDSKSMEPRVVRPVNPYDLKLYKLADTDIFDIYYQVHAEDFSWLGWTKNGAST